MKSIIAHVVVYFDILQHVVACKSGKVGFEGEIERETQQQQKIKTNKQAAVHNKRSKATN